MASEGAEPVSSGWEVEEEGLADSMTSFRHLEREDQSDDEQLNEKPRLTQSLIGMLLQVRLPAQYREPP